MLVTLANSDWSLAYYFTRVYGVMIDPFALTKYISKQRAEQNANKYLQHPPFLGDRASGVEPTHNWKDPDPTWYSDVHNCRLVRRGDMRAALERHNWKPRGLTPDEVRALLEVLTRPTRTVPGSAKVTRTPPTKKRGLDAPTQNKVPPLPKRQPLLSFPRPKDPQP